MKKERIWLAEEVGGIPTFWGTYLRYRDIIIQESGWNDETTRGYESSYVRIICTNLKNHNRMPISGYNRADYDAAIQRIKKAGYEKEKGVFSSYKPSTLAHFLSLIRTVVTVAAREYLCDDVFAAHPAVPVKKDKKSDKQAVPRAMSIQAEHRIGEALLTDPMQSGEFMGLAGMFCWGGRNAESCGMNFGDLKLWRNIPGCWVVWVYKSTVIDSNAVQSSGKTRNADRVVLLPSKYVKLVLERKQRLRELLGDGVNIDELPVACRGNNYFERCSADNLTAAAHTLFERVGITREQIQQTYEEMRLAEDGVDDPLNRISYDLLDCSSPTAYFLRRTYGTSLACVGLTAPQVAFQIGHDMGGLRETRNEFLNTKMLLEIKEKIDRRAIVNAHTDLAKPIRLVVNQGWESFPSGTTEFLIPEGAERIYLQLTAREPLDDIRIELRTAEDEQTTQLYCVQYGVSPGTYPKQLDIADDYDRLYRKYQI